MWVGAWVGRSPGLCTAKISPPQPPPPTPGVSKSMACLCASISSAVFALFSPSIPCCWSLNVPPPPKQKVVHVPRLPGQALSSILI